MALAAGVGIGAGLTAGLVGINNLMISIIALPYLVMSMKMNMPKKETMVAAAKTPVTLLTVFAVCNCDDKIWQLSPEKPIKQSQ